MGGSGICAFETRNEFPCVADISACADMVALRAADTEPLLEKALSAFDVTVPRSRRKGALASAEVLDTIQQSSKIQLLDLGRRRGDRRRLEAFREQPELRLQPVSNAAVAIEGVYLLDAIHPSTGRVTRSFKLEIKIPLDYPENR